MNIILLTHGQGRTRRHSIHSIGHFILLGFLSLLLLAAIGAAGYKLGQWRQTSGYVASWQSRLAEQQEAVERIRRTARDEVDALTARLAELQSRVTRLDALGRKLIDVSRIDAEEFDFDSTPGVGGPAPADGESLEGYQVSEVSQAIDRLERRLQNREHQLVVLEEVLAGREFEAVTTPAGRPILKGWLSSPFGYREDPFTGKRAWHAGIDFAGAEGSAVVAVAGGVVTHAGKRWGYGHMVEITHGNGYVTRYAHNAELLVEEGEVVRPGDRIAKMGSSGRSTGPHVHLEVLKDGEAVNPWKFVQAER